MNIYHYTNLDAAVKILQKDNICFGVQDMIQ